MGNQKVWVKVIGLDDNGKMSLSMKSCDQGDGRDKDPEHRNADNDRRNATAWRPKETIKIGAIVNATCARCGAHGHLTSECMAPEGVRYETLDSEDDADAETAPASKEKQRHLQEALR